MSLASDLTRYSTTLITISEFAGFMLERYSAHRHAAGHSFLKTLLVQLSTYICSLHD